MGKIDWDIKIFLSEVNTLKWQIITSIDVKNLLNGLICTEYQNSKYK